MLERKIINQLNQWKRNPDGKCLLITGARQVGKSFTVKEFARQYAASAYLNFEENPELKMLFANSLNPQDIINKMKFHPRFNRIDFSQRVLIIFDEIQSCPAAITALKFFAEAGEHDVIGTGSLLGVSLASVSSFPVGYVKQIEMLPLDFEEFLWAMDVSADVIDAMINTDELPDFAHQRFLDLFKQYLIIGGMPKVVQMWVNGCSYQESLEEQRQIIMAYKNDIAKYADLLMREKTRECFESIPQQLAKDNKKFQYKHLGHGARASRYETSINWIVDAGLGYKCFALTNLELPLNAYQIPNKYKLYFFDTGLLVATLDDGTADKILNGDLGIYKGALYENIVATVLKAGGKQLSYYEKDGKWEIDFVIVINGEVVPLEVKSGDNTMSKSLNALIASFSLTKGIKVTVKNKRMMELVKIGYIPLYLLPFLERYLERKI